ncbi:phage tail protein [Oxalobacter formigenes]|uniref:phage tail protein n=1 Tax=Oxalobacter formigenes TaxID=847 RepID=UPI0022AF44DA|nr:phage tail protein [Oxalobacter formigenes]WAW06073.1 phage tail protein [Oxalobacter formigenes]
MAQPPAYIRNKDFTEDFGNETDHSSLNAELDRASNSINDIRFNLAIIQADDGKLRPSVVTADSISEELRVSLVEGVVMDAQSMLDRSLAAADASSAFAEASSVSAKAAKASEEKALESSSMAGNSAKEAADSAKAIALAINSDWDATEGAAEILNKPALSAVALSGNYEDLSGKPDNLATDDDIAVLQEEIAKKGVPVGTIEYFATSTPPAGYLKADGAAVGRETYPDLFAAIGTAFGEGDGSTTFNLPDLIDRFALLPCIKAFDAATNPGLIDITELANEMAGKVDRYIDSKPVRYVIDAYNDGTNWYRKWSDGWLEQGGILAAENRSITLIFLLPFLDNKYSISKNIGSNLGTTASDAGVSFQSLTQTSAITVQSTNYLSSRWYACGRGAQS